MQRVLELAFDNLQRERVAAEGNDDAASGFLTSIGFRRIGGGFALARRQWQKARHRPALAALNPSLKSILAAELAAGNEVAELQIDWPEPGSVFIRLRREFWPSTTSCLLAFALRDSTIRTGRRPSTAPRTHDTSLRHGDAPRWAAGGAMAKGRCH
jgi:hypothetical protein